MLTSNIFIYLFFINEQPPNLVWKNRQFLRNSGFSLVFEVIDCESDARFSNLKMAHPIWRTSNRKIHEFSRYFALGGFWGCWLEIWNYICKIQNVWSNMADAISKILSILLILYIWGFLGSLITNLKSYFQNSKWRIRYCGHEIENSMNFSDIFYSAIFGVAN